MMHRVGWVIAFVLLAVAGCGGGDDLCLTVCDPTPTATPGPEDSVTVTGTGTEVSTFDPVEDVVVIACVGLDPARTDPTDWNDCDSQRNTSPDSSGDFEISRVETGALRIGFWISRSGMSNGLIQEGDSFAELLEPAAELVELLAVEEGETVTLSDIFVDFAEGTATASSIDVGVTPTPTPSTTPAQ